MTFEVPITPELKEAFTTLGRERADYAERAGKQTRGPLYPGQSLQNHTIGAVGEVVYSKLTGLPIDRFRTGDDGDFKGVEIKTTTSTSPVLKLHPEAPSTHAARVFILCQVDPELSRSVTFTGYLFREEFVKWKREVETQYGKRWVVDATTLHDITENHLIQGGFRIPSMSALVASLKPDSLLLWTCPRCSIRHWTRMEATRKAGTVWSWLRCSTKQALGLSGGDLWMPEELDVFINRGLIPPCEVLSPGSTPPEGVFDGNRPPFQWKGALKDLPEPPEEDEDSRQATLF